MMGAVKPVPDTRRTGRPTLIIIVAAWLAGCWPGPLVRLPLDGGGVLDGDGGDLSSAGFIFQSLAPCFAASDYMTGSTISFGTQLGNNYSPRCLVIHAGQTVTFAGDFSSHPLHPSTRGTPGNPVQQVGGGSSTAVTFTTVGFFPFYCTQHGDDLGNGMAGVVQVQAP
jgi:plastocyanin